MTLCWLELRAGPSIASCQVRPSSAHEWDLVAGFFLPSLGKSGLCIPTVGPAPLLGDPLCSVPESGVLGEGHGGRPCSGQKGNSFWDPDIQGLAPGVRLASRWSRDLLRAPYTLWEEGSTFFPPFSNFLCITGL